MTADERAHIRALVDQVRREKLRGVLCELCGIDMPEHRAPHARYCSEKCKRQAWRKTPQGLKSRREQIARKRRERAMATA